MRVYAFVCALYALMHHAPQEMYMEGRKLRIADKVAYRDAPFFEREPARLTAVQDAAAAQLRAIKQAA